MHKLHFAIIINAPKAKVWSVMMNMRKTCGKRSFMRQNWTGGVHEPRQTPTLLECRRA